MPDALTLAHQRQQAVEQLQARLSQQVDDAQRSLLEGLLARVQDIHADPSLVAALLADFQATVATQLALHYGSQVLTLPALSQPYYEGQGIAGYSRLRQPLEAFLRGRLGLDADGNALPNGYVDLLARDTQAQLAVVRYAYSAQAAGVGLAAYREGLTDLITANGGAGQGVMQLLYKQSYDDVNRADRMLQQQVADRLALPAYIYQGGVIKTSRPFCVVRNGKAFAAWEVARFGTPQDAFGGYSDKADGEFAGKSVPYDPVVDCGGYNCRHGLHPVPASVALGMRPDLVEDESGRLMLR